MPVPNGSRWLLMVTKPSAPRGPAPVGAAGRLDDLANPGGPAVAPDGEPDERIADCPRAGVAPDVRVVDLNENVVAMQLDAARDEGRKAEEEDEDRPVHRRGCGACKT